MTHLRCENNTLGDEITVCAADELDLAEAELQADFEHGQWFVTHLPSGAQWSANDAVSAMGEEYFQFEQVSEGDEDVLIECRESFS